MQRHRTENVFTPAEVALDAHGPQLEAPLVVELSDVQAADPGVTGVKAATLARAALAGLPVVPGFVVTTRGAVALSSLPAIDSRRRAAERLLELAWSALSRDGERPLIVRSSATVEGGPESSTVGAFESVADVRDWRSFRRAIACVISSNQLISLDGVVAVPMAILVQLHLEPTRTGVVWGGLAVQHAWAAGLGRREVKSLARLERFSTLALGTPQRVEWGVGADGRLWIFQTRFLGIVV